MKTILFISHLYPFDGNDAGTSRALHNFAKYWDGEANLHVVRPMYYNPLKRWKVKLFFTTRLDGVRIQHIPVIHIPFPRHFICVDILVLYFLICRGIHPDIVVSHLGPDYVWARRIARFFSARFVIGLHGSDVRGSLKRRRAWFRAADLVACRSPEIRKKFVSSFPRYSEKSFLAVSGIESREIEPIAFWDEKIEAWGRETRFVTVAKLIPLKNIDIIIEALDGLRGMDWKYDVVGEGPERQRLGRMVTEAGLEDRIRFIGYLSRQEVLKTLRDYHVFLMPSAPETFGLTYLEAMSKGCVPVCAKGWGIDGIIQDGENGFCVPARDVIGLSSLLSKIMELPGQGKRRLLINVLETIRDYSEEGKAKEYLEKLLAL
jgi:L-malate glycosyltransferase